jgi:bifunctional non-homologous end joining protein LigD
MLLRSARLPTSGDYSYEPKWDGFRCLVSRNGRLRAVSPRWWDMKPLLPELEALPDGLAVDGELVAFGDDGRPSFPRLCERVLHGKHRIPIVLVVFDVLAIDRRDVTRRPYWERRELLEQLDLHGEHWATTPAYRDGDGSGWRVSHPLPGSGVPARRKRAAPNPGTHKTPDATDSCGPQKSPRLVPLYHDDPKR